MKRNKRQVNEFESMVFMHIPKCGGVSFRRFIVDAALRGGISVKEIYAPGEKGLEDGLDLCNLDREQLNKLNKDRLKVFADHSTLNVYQKCGFNLPSPFRYTVLRDPVARFISHYYFFCYSMGCADCEECKDIGLEDLTEEGFQKVLQMFGNLQVKYLAEYEGGIVTQKILARAKENLNNQFHAFGILERLPESIELLRRQSPSWLIFKKELSNLNRSNDQGTPISGIRRMLREKLGFNKNNGQGSTKSGISQTLREKLIDGNQFDVELYEYANELFLERLG